MGQGHETGGIAKGSRSTGAIVENTVKAGGRKGTCRRVPRGARQTELRITDPIIIRKTGKKGYVISGRLEGCRTIRRYGRSEEEAKERFFEACNEEESRTPLRARSSRAPSRKKTG